jgi:two-component system, OmpR family, response regulator
LNRVQETLQEATMKKRLDGPVLLTVPDAAKLCGVSRNTLFLWVRDGKLKAYQTPGRTNQIRPSDLLSFMKKSGMFVPAALLDLAHQDEKAGIAAEAAVDTRRNKVLVVDDDSAVRNLMVRALRGLSGIYQAETGFEAMHLLTLHKSIQVVLLDLRMPGWHGIEALKEIRKSRPDVAVVIVTGYEGEIPPDMLKSGAITRLIRKPFEIAELRKVVKELLEKHRTGR